jgi:hypothetical protein
MAMQLASMVHGSVREREAFQQPPASAYYQHTQHRGYPAPSAASNSYARPTYRPDHPYQRAHPQSPPSPPVEEKKPSLPSISSLLEIAGGEKSASETSKSSRSRAFINSPLTVGAAQSPQTQQRQSSSPQPRQPQHNRGAGAMQQPPHPHSSRPEQLSGYIAAPPVHTHRMTLPPTPPMHPDAAGEGNRSPSTASTHSAASAPYYVGNSLNNLEPHHQRQATGMSHMKRDAPPPHTMSPYGPSVYAQSPYASSPGGASASSFYSPEQHSYSSLGMYAQRPLPSHFQTQGMPLPVPVPSPGATGSNPWQHHHYISTSSQSAFPQSQDRYICSTCNKAFSRPSSLRIHSHSHTGEKPYKCPQPGCGKAFSVRSNMKRHERGCHAATSTTVTTS